MTSQTTLPRVPTARRRVRQQGSGASVERAHQAHVNQLFDRYAATGQISVDPGLFHFTTQPHPAVDLA
jgi:hypothetical protein